MFETYRMLGDEREAKLLREAQRLHALPPSKFCARLSRAFSLARRLVLPDRASELEMRSRLVEGEGQLIQSPEHQALTKVPESCGQLLVNSPRQ
jgi:hypothetical protein